MPAVSTCPRCGFVNAASSFFCAGCGLPRSAVERDLREAASGSETRYEELLQQATVLSGPLSQLMSQMDERIAALERDTGGLEARLYSIETGSRPAGRPVSEPASPSLERQILAPAAAVTRVVPSDTAPEPVSPPARTPSTVTAEKPRVQPPAPRKVAGPPPADRPARIAPPVAKPRPSMFKTDVDLEALISGRGLAIIGGLAVLVGAIFFLSMAFNRGWIGPTARVSLGVIVAAAMVAGGWRFFERKERLFGHVLVAVGLGIMSLSLFASTELYDLIPVPLALAGVLVTAVAAALIAVRVNSQIVAGFGVVTGLAAPPIFGASVDMPTVAFLGVMLVGVTLIALSRTWNWLPPAAFLLTVPQIASWVWDDAQAGAGMAAVGAFWMLTMASAGGQEFRRPVARRLEPVASGLMAANSAFLLLAGFELLAPPDDNLRGLFLFSVAAAHAIPAGYFLTRKGAQHPFGMLVAGVGLATLAAAIPVQFGGPVVPIVWASIAIALAWAADQRSHRFAAGAALALGALAVGHLVAFEYQMELIGDARESANAFLHGTGLAAIFVAGALASVAALTRRTPVRLTLLGAALLLSTYIVPFELSGLWLVAGWLAIVLAAISLHRLFGPADQPALWRPEAPPSELPLHGSLPGAALIAGALAIVHLFSVEVTQGPFESLTRPDPSFSDQSALAAAMIFVAMAAGALLTQARWIHYLMMLTAVGVATAIAPFQVSASTTVVLWSALALVPLFLRGKVDEIWTGYCIEAAVIGLLAWIVAIARVAPSDQLLEALPRGNGTSLVGGALVVMLAIAGASAIAAHRLRDDPYLSVPIASLFGALTYLVRFQTSWAATVAGWSALAIVAVMLESRLPIAQKVLRGTLVVLLAAGIEATFSKLAPLDRLFVDATSTVDHPFMWSAATVALGALAVATYAVYQRVSSWRYGWAALAASGGLAVYMVSVAVVDHFQAQTGGTVDLETLDRRAQVALSILWAVCGGTTFAFGIVRKRRPARVLGLGLLGAATTKVFIYDLAFLNASYRVLSFIGLGVLLLASSYLYQRLIESTEDDASELPSENDLQPVGQIGDWLRGGHDGWLQSHRPAHHRRGR